MKVACLGLAVCDFLVSPVAQDVMQRDFNLIDTLNVATGGDAVNVAVNLSHMGVSTSLYCGVGADPQGRFIIDTVEAAGVETAHIVGGQACGTSTSIVLIREDGEHTFAYYGGASDRYAPSEAAVESILTKDVLYIGSACMLPKIDGRPTRALLRRAKQAGLITAMDMSGNPSEALKEELLESLPLVDYFLPSIDEARALTGLEAAQDIAACLRARGTRCAVIKCGDKGCFLSCDVFTGQIEGFRANVLDTTGAGDSFVSGFLCGIINGRDAREGAVLGNRAGALCVENYGAATWRSTYAQLCALAGL